jgi:hypothetical protein
MGWTVIIAALFVIGAAIAQQAAPPIPAPEPERVFTYGYCVTIDEREHIREIILDALDKGLKKHTENLFNVMLKDPRGQPQRAIAGLRPGVVAFASARKALVQWHPPICEEEKK